MRRIARETGYSTATVSRALAGSNLITADTRQTVLNCARVLGYRFDNCRQIAVITPDLGGRAYFGPLVHMLAAELEKYDFIPVMISLKHLKLIEQLPFCGAISLLSNDGFERYWGERHIVPLVCINTSPRHLDGIFMVGSNDAQGMELAVNHLLELGHTRIGRIGGRHSFNSHDNWNSRARDISFRNLMEANHLAADLHTILDDAGMIESVKSVLDRNVTALINLNEGDELAVYHALNILGRKIPEDISVVSWSEDYVAPYLFPPLTSLRQNYMMLVQESCKLLRQQLAGETVEGDVLVDYHFVVGGSTAAPRRITRRRRGK